MSFCRWSSVLERQMGINLAICTSAFLDELVSESSGDEDLSLSEGNSSNSSNSNSSSSDSTLPSESGSSGTRSEMSEVSSWFSLHNWHPSWNCGTGAWSNGNRHGGWYHSMGKKINYSRFEWRWCIDTLPLSKNSSARGSRQALAKASMFSYRPQRLHQGE